MSPFEIIGGILLLITGILIIVIIMTQQGRQAGMNAVTGASSSTDSYLGKNKGRTLDAILARWTKIAAGVFFALTIVVNLVNIFAK